MIKLEVFMSPKIIKSYILRYLRETISFFQQIVKKKHVNLVNFIEIRQFLHAERV